MFSRSSVVLRTVCRAGFNDFCIEGVARRVVVLVGSAILRFCGYCQGTATC
jgi:hypothetical protein